MHPLLISKGNKPRKGKVKKCAWCGLEVYKLPVHAKRAVSFCSEEHHWEYQRNSRINFYFNCVICEVKVFTVPSQVRLRNRKTCSRSCSALLRRKNVQEKRKTYTKHQIDRLARYSPEAKKWRESVFQRDNWTCQFCHIRGNYLEADHIKPWAYFPELRFELSNGRTLCRPCHDKTKTSAKAMREEWKKEVYVEMLRELGINPDLTHIKESS